MTVVTTLIATLHINVGLQQPTYYALYARAPEFLIGSLVAQMPSSTYERNGRFGFIGCILVAVPLIFFSEKTNVPGLMACIPALGGAIILLNPSPFMSRFLSFPLMTWIGNISYSLYLWHWIVLAFLRYVTGEQLIPTVYAYIYWIVSFLLASLSYYGIEDIFRRRKKYRMLLWSLLIATLFGVFQSSSCLNQSLSSLPIEYTRYAEPDSICDGKIVGNCLRGDLSSPQSPILVLGDSHASMMNHFFEKIGKELNLSFRIISADNCLTIPSLQSPKLILSQEKGCQSQRAVAAKYMDSADRIIVAGYWKYHQHHQRERFLPQMQHWIENYEHKAIFLLADVPFIKGCRPERMYRFSQIGITFCKADIGSENAKQNQIIKSLADKYASVTYMDLLSTGFFDEFYLDGKYPKYYDKHHLNEEAAKLYATFSIDLFKQYLEEKTQNLPMQPRSPNVDAIDD